MFWCVYYWSSFSAEPNRSVGSVADSRREGRWFDPCSANILPKIDDSHCDRIHFSLSAVRYFDNGYVGKQPVAWKEYCAEYWLKELQESMDKFTGRLDITDTLLKTALNTVQPSSFCLFSILGAYIFNVSRPRNLKGVSLSFPIRPFIIPSTCLSVRLSFGLKQFYCPRLISETTKILFKLHR